jgi:hypothetical protein
MVTSVHDWVEGPWVGRVSSGEVPEVTLRALGETMRLFEGWVQLLFQ